MLQTNQTNSLKDVDITQLYTMLRHLVKRPTNYPWGRDDVPKENDTEKPDDIERIRHYRNRVCHSDASEMDTSMFNDSVLDLLGVIYDNSKFVRNIFKVYQHPRRKNSKMTNVILITG